LKFRFVPVLGRIGANEDSVVGHEVEIIIVFGPGCGFVPAVKRTIYFSLSLFR
jgi:hypothetical protein